MSPSSSGTRRPRLLVMSPAVDMYGSDRSLLPVLEQLTVDHDLTLVAPAEGPLVDAATAIGCDCHVLGDWALRRSMVNLSSLPSTTRQVRSAIAHLRRLHRETPFAGIYANTTANALLPFLKRAVPVPLVVHVRELPRDRPRLLRLLLHMVDRAADAVICNSSFTAETAIEVVPRLADRVSVRVNGVPEPGREPRTPTDDGVLDVVCVGRIHPKKGHSVLIEAMALAAARGERWRLHVHGDALEMHASLEQELREQVRRAGLDEHVHWYGYSSDVDDLYDDADVVVVPSVITEEFSRVAAEAHMRGLPAVVTGPGGASEVVADGVTGRVVPARDAEALSLAIGEVTDPVTRRTWGEAARLRARSRFTEQAYAADVARFVTWAVSTRPCIFALSPSSDLYGSDRALLHALPGLQADHDVVLGVACPGPLVEAARTLGVPVVELPDYSARRRYLTLLAAPGVISRSARTLWAIRRRVRRLGSELVYVNTVAVPALPLLSVVARRPVVVHVHERARGGRWEQNLIRAAVRMAADVVVANSDFTAATLDLDRSSVQVEVVHNGVDPAPPADPAPGGPVRLVCVARLHPKKGQWVLIDALAELRNEGHDVALDLVGDALPEHAGLERDLRAQVTRLGLDDSVVFHGYLADVDPVYRRGHVVVVPSVDPEEFSLVAAEGQMRGLPAVVTGPGGVTEVVVDGTTGLVVAPHDVSALAGALAELISDRDRMAAMGAAGRERMLAHFTADAYRARLGRVVSGLTSARP